MTRNKDLELYKKVYDFLQTHTYKQTAIEFSISEKQISRIVKYMQEQENLNVPATEAEPSIPQPTSQPEPELPAVGSRTAADQEIEEPRDSTQKKDRIAEILSTKKPKDQKNRKQATDWYLKTLILKNQEKFYQQFDNTIKISF